MKKILFLVLCLCSMSIFAQTFKETFDSNSLEWTERPYKNEQGNAIIDKGVMTVKSYTKVDLLAGYSYNTSFETHCYAPIDVKKPFTITSNVTVKNGEEIGIIFNFRDFGNYYAFVMAEDYVKFIRFEDGSYVGSITQGIRWKKKRKVEQTWVLRSNNETIEFVVNDEPIIKVRYMPLEYAGFGYYSVGKCELIIDDVEFKQGL